MALAIKKRIRVEYFQVCGSKDGAEDNLFDFREWIAYADKIDISERKQKYYTENARLESAYPKNELWFLNFARLSENDIPKKARENEKAEPMELQEGEYIARDLTILYDKDNSIMAFQKNKGSLSVSGLEEYVNQIWNKKDEQSIYFRPLLPIDVLNKINDKSGYTVFRIKFANMNNAVLPEESGALGEMFNSIGKYTPIIADVRMSVGRSKGTFLDRDNIRKTVRIIDENRGVITKAEVGIKTDDEPEAEVLDLFEERMHDYITVYLQKKQSLASEYIADQMIEVYNKRKAQIALQIKKF